MNFGEFYQQILASVFPGKDSPRLTTRHRNSVMDALTRVQRYAKCYRNQHEQIVHQDDTTFVSGISVFPRPQGQPWEVRIELLDATGDFVLAQPYTFAQMRAVAESIGSCNIPEPCPPGVTGYDPEYGDYETNCAPTPKCLPSNYAASMDGASMYLYPALPSCARVVVSWTGIKRMWGDNDEIPWLDEDGFVDRDVFRAVEEYLRARTAYDDDCNMDKGNAYMAMHHGVIAELNAICARRHEVVGPPILFPWTGSSRVCEPPLDLPIPTVEPPTFTPVAGTYNTPQWVEIFSDTPEATIHYTIDGNNPTTSSPIYTGPIPISTNTKVTAMAVKEGHKPSIIRSSTYTILTTTPRVSKPVFSPPPGIYHSAKAISITTLTSGATIRYTIDGTEPNNTTSPVLALGGTVPLPMYGGFTLKAIAYKDGMTPSEKTEGDYEAVLPPPIITYTKTSPQEYLLDGSVVVGVIISMPPEAPAGAEIYWVSGTDSDSVPTTEYPPPFPWLKVTTPGGLLTNFDVSRQFKAYLYHDGHISEAVVDAFALVLPVYYGFSSLASLDATQIQSLPGKVLNYHWVQVVAPDGSFEWGPPITGPMMSGPAKPDYTATSAGGQYFYIAWDGTYPAPISTDGFRTVSGSIQTALLMADASDGYTELAENGWQHKLVDLNGGGLNVKLYRSKATTPFPAGSHAVRVALNHISSGPVTTAIRWGHSPSAMLDEAGIKALANSATGTDPFRTFTFTGTTVNDYLHLWWPDAFPNPALVNGFMLGIYPASMAAGPQGFTDGPVNGWWYKSVSVDGVPGRLWRTFGKPGGGATTNIIVQ